MRSIPFQSVLFETARLLGLNPNRDLSLERAAVLCSYINSRISYAWRFDFWPEWLLTERRRYRPNYTAGLFVTATDELWFVPAQKYYQALQQQISATNAPATLVSGTYVLNAAYWAEVATTYDATWWATGTVFSVGDQTRNLDDGEYYQCIVAHTAGASFTAANFGLLTPFNRVVDSTQDGATVIDAVKQFSRRDPRVFPDKYWPVSCTKSDAGYQLPVDAPDEVWVQFRTTPPTYTVERWSAATTYDVGDLVYYATNTVNGNVYESAIGNNTQPVDGVVNWILVPFPAVLANYVQHAAKADALSDHKQTDRARAELAVADDNLQDALDQELAQQGQFERASVVVS